VFDSGEIASDDLMRRCQEEGKDKSTDHQYEKSNISPIIDILKSRVPILPHGDSSSDDSSEIENGPEETNVATFLLFGGIRHHDSTLCGP